MKSQRQETLPAPKRGSACDGIHCDREVAASKTGEYEIHLNGWTYVFCDVTCRARFENTFGIDEKAHGWPTPRRDGACDRCTVALEDAKTTCIPNRDYRFCGRACHEAFQAIHRVTIAPDPVDLERRQSRRLNYDRRKAIDEWLNAECAHLSGSTRGAEHVCRHCVVTLLETHGILQGARVLVRPAEPNEKITVGVEATGTDE